MSSFNEASQARAALKMKASVYAWYKGSHIISTNDGYQVIIEVTTLDNTVRKVIPPLIGNVEVRTELVVA